MIALKGISWLLNPHKICHRKVGAYERLPSTSIQLDQQSLPVVFSGHLELTLISAKLAAALPPPQYIKNHID